MTASWPAFFGALAAAFVAINLVFAFVYAAGDEPVANARPGSLSDLFFFSVETTSTVGYGDMHPQTLYAHIVATSENFIGLVMLAVMTGLVFARFSRPRARLIFAKNPVIAEHDGTPTLIFRLANARNAFISEAAAKLWMLRATANAEGRRFVGFQPLRLHQKRKSGFRAELDAVPPDRRRQSAARRERKRASRQRDQFRRQHQEASTKPRRRPSTRATPSPRRTCGRATNSSTSTASTSTACAISTTPRFTTRDPFGPGPVLLREAPAQDRNDDHVSMALRRELA